MDSTTLVCRRWEEGIHSLGICCSRHDYVSRDSIWLQRLSSGLTLWTGSVGGDIGIHGQFSRSARFTTFRGSSTPLQGPKSTVEHSGTAISTVPGDCDFTGAFGGTSYLITICLCPTYSLASTR